MNNVESFNYVQTKLLLFNRFTRDIWLYYTEKDLTV